MNVYQIIWADNAVSMTINFPKGKYRTDEATA